MIRLKSEGHVLTRSDFIKTFIAISGFKRSLNFEMAAKSLGAIGFSGRRKARRLRILSEAEQVVADVMGDEGSEKEADYIERCKPKPNFLYVSMKSADILREFGMTEGVKTYGHIA